MSKLNVTVHPSAMLVMSNQYTRLEYDNANVPLPVHVGLLLGSSKGGYIEVTSAFELLITGTPDNLEVNQKFLENGYKNLHKATFPTDVPIGWYTCTKLSDNLRDEVSRRVEEIATSYDSELLLFGEFIVEQNNNNENPEKCPLTLYSANVQTLSPIDYTYETEPAERIAMMQLQSGGSAEDQIKFTANAFQSLDEDLEKVQKYLEKVLKKEVPFDHDNVRFAATLSQWWDHNNTEENTGSDKVEEQANLALLCGLLLETLTLYEKNA